MRRAKEGVGGGTMGSPALNPGLYQLSYRHREPSKDTARRLTRTAPGRTLPGFRCREKGEPAMKADCRTPLRLDGVRL